MKSFANLVMALILVLMPLCAPLQAADQASDQDEAFMRECFALARFAIQRGDDPFGAVLVKDGAIIMRASNSVRTDNDKLRHAETNLIGLALRDLSRDAIKGSTLYTSCEPCSMCCGAINLMDGYIVRMVYGLPGQRLVEMVGMGKAMSSQGFFRWVGNDLVVHGPVLEAEAEAVIREYLELAGKGPILRKNKGR